MKKKKLKLKSKKQTFRKLRRDNWVLVAVLLLFLVIGALVGAFIAILYMLNKPYNQHPKNVVIAADNTISVPKDLVDFLSHQDECPAKVGLYSVYQVSQRKFAKLSYGCSTSLTNYRMAVKNNNQWQLIPVREYFQAAGFLPKCIQVEKYQIDRSIEPFCIKEGGMARDNALK